MIFNLLLLFIPVSLALRYLFHLGPIWIFLTSLVAIIPLAEWIRQATEQMAIQLGPAIGGLLNVTFGNMAELILALFVLMAGHQEVVKGQITGSIIGNSLLGLGLAIVLATWGKDHLKFEKAQAGRLSSLLILSVIALLIPALFDYTERGLFAQDNPLQLDEWLSLAVSVTLLVVYAANLVYSLYTHRDEFASDVPEKRATWSKTRALIVLLVATALTAVEAEQISGSLEGTAGSLGLSTFFLGVIVLAVIGNAAEYVASIYFARQDNMGLALNISAGSSIQVALMVAPLLVIISNLLGSPMNLVFVNPLELIALAGVAFAVNSIAQDGEVTWFEGILLISIYVMLAFAFFFATPPVK